MRRIVLSSHLRAASGLLFIWQEEQREAPRWQDLQRPFPIQKRPKRSLALISGPTANCPADPPAIPNICVAPIKVAAREGWEVLRSDVDGSHQRKDTAGSLQQPAYARCFIAARGE